jgi:hypothetical protein
MKYTVSDQAGRLLASAKSNDATGCLECSCHRVRGYGKVRVSGKWMAAHRVVWESANGQIPEGLVIMHKCDNPACINIDHLRTGTHSENTRDKFLKQRGRNQAGAQKLNEDAVKKIRDLYTLGNISQGALSLMFNVGRDVISRVITRSRWGYVS